MRNNWVALVLGLVAAGLSCAPKTPDREANMPCVERLVIPEYPPFAESAMVTGTMSVDIRLAEGGRVQSVSCESTSGQPKSPLFCPQVEASVRESTFTANCGGKTVRLILAFRFTKPTERDGRTMSFGYPNRFDIAVTPPMINTRRDEQRRQAP